MDIADSISSRSVIFFKMNSLKKQSKKQLLSKSFYARSVLGKPCSKQVSSTELIDLLPE